jgi:hypothetical protein
MRSRTISTGINPLVPRRHIDEKGFKLGLWVMYQRDRYRAGELAEACIAALESLLGWIGMKTSCKSL